MGIVCCERPVAGSGLADVGEVLTMMDLKLFFNVEDEYRAVARLADLTAQELGKQLCSTVFCR